MKEKSRNIIHGRVSKSQKKFKSILPISLIKRHECQDINLNIKSLT